MFTGRANSINVEQDMQCTYNVTLWLIRANIVAAEKQYLLHIVGVCL